MDLEKKIIVFAKLGEILREAGGGKQKPELTEAIKQAHKHNGWFTEENILLAVSSLGEMLREEKIRKWLSKYKVQSTKYKATAEKLKSIGVIMAGNIPLVGFHDFMSVLMSGNIFVGKLASDDKILLPAVAEILMKIEPEFKNLIHFLKVQGSMFRVTDSTNKKRTLNSEPATAVDAFIATGSNNSARYFEYYFGKYPHIIRRNRNAVAILDGKETEEDLQNLGKDIFQYFGMGCRNVSKIYIPKDYNLDKFFAAIVDFGDVINHNKYYNNHQYYRTIYLLNKEKFLDNNFLMLKESEQIPSPVATLYYERYSTIDSLMKKLELEKESIQCIVTSSPALLLKEKGVSCVRFGQTQNPELWDYADGVDTMEFLLSLK